MPDRSGARPLTRLEVLRALRLSNFEAVAATVHGSITAGPFQTGFALWLGASGFWMGVIGAIPTFAALVQLASSLWVERLGERKRITAWFSLIARTLWLPILLLPWVLPANLRLAGFVVLLGLSSLALQVPVPAFTSWLSDLVPADHRGRYFGRRNMLAGITAMAASLPPAWFLDRAISGGVLSEPVGFAVLFAVAVVFGVVSFAILLKQAEPPLARADAPRETGLAAVVAAYRQPVADRGFRAVLWFGGVFAVGQFFAAPFYTVYALQDLKLSYMWLQILGAVASLASLASMPLWGNLSDKFGNRPLLVIAVAGVSFTPLPWIAARPDSVTAALVILCLNNIVGGVFWAGVGLLQFNVLIEATPPERRSVYVGALSAITGVAGGLAPVLGGVVVEALRSHPMMLMGITLNSYHVVFGLNALLRLLALPIVRVLPASRGTSASDVLGRLGAVRVGSLIQMHRLQRGHNERERRQAVSALSNARLALAVQELTLALSDPSHRVRREATRALGDIGDAVAVGPLVERMGDPLSGLAVEAAEALGRIGDASAVAALTRLLRSPKGDERTAAARALERIGDGAALPGLMAALDQALADGDCDEAGAMVAALGACGDVSVIERLAGLLRHERREIRGAAFAALGEIGDAGVGDPVEAAFLAETDPVVQTQAARALAATGRVSAMAAMYRSMVAMESEVARKQMANAIGALLEDAQMYRMLSGSGMDHDESVLRLIRSLGTRADSRRPFGVRRRARLIELAAESMAAGEASKAAGAVLRLAGPCQGPLGDLLIEARRSVARREPTPEEMLVITSAVRVALSRGRV
jgi:HEAT repeat protein